MTRPDPARDAAIARARAAAQHALSSVERVVGDEGGFVRLVAEESLAETAVTAAGADALADLVPPLAEHLRHFRALYGELTSATSMKIDLAPTGSGLPLNRKEPYYTGTVLPMLVASDGFAHLHRLLALCGLDVGPLGDHGREGATNLQFFTEYNFAESVRDTDTARFPDAPTSRDTPDVLLVGPDWMLAIEAKMFHDPDVASLDAQMDRQRPIVDYLGSVLGIPTERVAHVLLLPEGLPSADAAARVVTWEQVLLAYRVVGPQYWVLVLAGALARYEELRSRSAVRGANKDGDLSGAEIVASFRSGGGRFTCMGRNRGLHGPDLMADISSGAWRTRRYEVRIEPLVATNWFPISDFVALVDPDPGT